MGPLALTNWVLGQLWMLGRDALVRDILHSSGKMEWLRVRGIDPKPSDPRVGSAGGGEEFVMCGGSVRPKEDFLEAMTVLYELLAELLSFPAMT
jgi:hypothetical protein